MTQETRSVYRHADLSRLFNPSTIAIIGASSNSSSAGFNTLRHLAHYTGEIYCINPRSENINGRPCYASVKELPVAPDCAVLCVAQENVEKALIECAEANVGGVIVYASGYAELNQPEATRAQQRLSAISKQANLRVLGPNCLGIANFTSRAICTFSRGEINVPRQVGRGIGVVSQSGALGFSASQALCRGAAISRVIVSGNSCDIDISDCISYLAEDPAVASIIVVMEGLNNPNRLIEAGRIAWAADKPVMVCKLGNSESGAEAALSHSGSLAGSPAAYRALFDRAQIAMIDDLEALVETAAFFVKAPSRPKGKGVAVMAVSGGAAVFAADKAELHGVSMPQPSEATRNTLSEFVPVFGSTKNPADLTAMASRDPKNMPGAAGTLAADSQYSAIVFPQTSTNPNTVYELRQMAERCQTHGKPLCVSWMGGWIGAPATVPLEEDSNIALFHTMDRCMSALSLWHSRDQKKQQEKSAPLLTKQVSRPDSLKIRQLLAACTEKVLTERESKAILALYGVPVTPEVLVHSAEDAMSEALSFNGPVALKIESPDIPHKTEAGVIALNLRNREDILAGYQLLLDNAGKVFPKPHINGVLVQPMVAPGTEIIIGCKVDPSFGPLILVGIGGVFVEVLSDVIVELAPVTHTQAIRMISKLKGQAILNGFRGSKPIDRYKLADIITRLSELISDMKNDISELDVNPLICNNEQIVAVDALIVKAGLPLHD